MVGIEDERLMLMLRYFSICFHIPLFNRDVSTYGYFICGFTSISYILLSYLFASSTLPSYYHISNIHQPLEMQMFVAYHDQGLLSNLYCMIFVNLLLKVAKVDKKTSSDWKIATF